MHDAKFIIFVYHSLVQETILSRHKFKRKLKENIKLQIRKI